MTTIATRPTPTVEETRSTGVFTTGYRDLSYALKTLASPATGRKPLPVFNRVLATVRPGEVELTTFDFDTALTVTLLATTTTPGQMLLEHQSLTKILTAAVKGTSKAAVDRLDVTVTSPEHTPVVHVTGYSMPLDDTIAVDAFPLPPATTAPTHVVDRPALSTLVERVTPAADRSDLVPILTGISAHLTGSSLVFTATDRYRLATGTIPAQGSTEEKVIIPATALAKLLPRLTSTQLRLGVDVIEGITWLTLADDTTTAQIRTLDGDYPNTSSIMNQATTRVVTLSRTQLLSAATRASCLAAAVKTQKTSTVTIMVSNETITIAPATDGDATNITAPSLPATITGEQAPWTATVNSGFFLDAIKTLIADEVTLHLGEPNRPLILTDADTTSYQHLLMPVRFAQ